MTSSRKQAILAEANCSVAFDNLTRQLYATDASIYRIEPQGVAFPTTAREAAAVIQAVIAAGAAVIPRGAGSGLAGGAIGDGIVVDFSRHNKAITDLDIEARTVRVGAGVVLDQLNAFLQPYGLCFGPDVATSSRATLGGMIANNSSGARVTAYGTTADHVKELEIVLSDGRIETIGDGSNSLADLRSEIERLVSPHAAEIHRRMPEGLLKRWHGYGIERFLRDPANLNHLIAGSEGTLAAIVSAKLNLVPLPKQKGLGLIFFDSVAEAMQATVELLQLQPAAIEHVDRPLFDQTRGQRPFQAARDLMELDSQTCESILIVEFFENVDHCLNVLSEKRLGLRTTILKDPEDMNQVWTLRKAGLSLLTGRKGPAKPTAGIEDIAVRPEQLPEYVEGVRSILRSLHLEASFYGHAAAGLLHVRPVLDLHEADDLKKFRRVADEVSTLVRQFKGSLSAEHGMGIARTEYLASHLGEDLIELHRNIKTAFDPDHRLNPGKIVDDGRYRLDTHLRMGAGYELKLPFAPTLAFAAKDESFVGNLEQCNGCGGCRKSTPTMCPTFIATGEELMSTRGRANLIRAVLERRDLPEGDPLLSFELDAALSNCLSCKACTTECPSNVNLALLKADLLHARHRKYGLSLSERVISSVDLSGRLGCLAPGPANRALEWKWLRRQMTRHLGLSEKRALPRFAEERFDHWFASRDSFPKSSSGKRVILWDDTFVRYHEPNIGKAAVRVLEAAGFEVTLLKRRKCCGRPAFSQGHLGKATRLGRHNLSLLRETNDPVIFLEPSCYSMFAEDYRELKLKDAESIATRCFLFEPFLDDWLQRDPSALAFNGESRKLLVHTHCHAKALLDSSHSIRLLRRVPGVDATHLNTGCCGMAGAFGAMESKYDLSLEVGEPLAKQILDRPESAGVVASGTSCRHQIKHLTSVDALHVAEVLAQVLS